MGEGSWKGECRADSGSLYFTLPQPSPRTQPLPELGQATWGRELSGDIQEAPLGCHHRPTDHPTFPSQVGPTSPVLVKVTTGFGDRQESSGWSVCSLCIINGGSILAGHVVLLNKRFRFELP